MRKVFFNLVALGALLSFGTSNAMNVIERSYHTVINAPKVYITPLPPTIESRLQSELGKCDKMVIGINSLALEFAAESLEAEYKRIFLGKDKLSDDELEEISREESELSDDLSNLPAITENLAKRCKGLPAAAYKLSLLNDMTQQKISALIWMSVAYILGHTVDSKEIGILLKKVKDKQ